VRGSQELHDYHEIEEVEVGKTTTLHIPEILPGRVVPKHAEDCKSIPGVVDKVLPATLLKLLLDGVKKDRDLVNLERATENNTEKTIR
tara:strand:- start:340 stop:603 length:264 start_codon:yes stop_codon:yes gene_type:complete